MEFDVVFEQNNQVLSVDMQEQTSTMTVDFQETSQTVTAAFDDDAELKADFGSYQTITGGDVSASVTQTDEGAVISITSNGVESTATVLHGQDGQPGNDGLPGVDGKNGVDGKDGYTPIKGVDYFDGEPGKDGYTPIKGVDYFDGVDGLPGADGQDGYTPIKGVDYFDGVDGKDGVDGSPGADGVSCTHSWDGTVLSVTSASGTSSADLKGEAGQPGADGSPGKDGADGYTPVKGTDYWTAEDKSEMVADLTEFLTPLLYYQAGDQIYIDYSTATYVTSAGTRIRWAIFLGKEIKASSFSLSGNLTVRQNGNYLFGDGTESTSISTLEMTNKKINANVLTVDIIKSAGYTNAVNNSPVGVLFRGYITFT